MTTLKDGINTEHGVIEEFLGITPGQWKRAVDRVQRIEEGELVAGERDWTFLLAIGYAAAGERGVAEMARLLMGREQELPPGPRVWLEGLPVPPRIGEGNTNLDLALGHIAWREGTQGGIRLDGRAPGRWACFCEMKTYSDIQAGVTRDLERNQLARVIENALCFQDEMGGGCCDAGKVHVTLVTPRRFGPTARREISVVWRLAMSRLTLTRLSPCTASGWWRFRRRRWSGRRRNSCGGTTSSGIWGDDRVGCDVSRIRRSVAEVGVGCAMSVIIDVGGLSTSPTT